MPKTTTLNLLPISDTAFQVSVQEYPLNDPSRRCPKSPKWVTDLVKNGQSMSLSSLIVQAGRHFSDTLNMEVSDGSATRRQLATTLAWTIIAMVRPTESNNRLVVLDPEDSDIKRLCSEILAVGAALELVRSQGRIDGRTIHKLSNRFDFQARERNGKGTTLIEAKGTFKGVSKGGKGGQRASFFSKLPPGKPRGYNRAIGVIFSTWTDAVRRGCDVELLDPEGEPITVFEETVREVIRFYARRFDEVVGKQEAAEIMLSLANSRQLMRGDEPLFARMDVRHRRTFSRGAMILRWRSAGAHRGKDIQEYWGGFWEARAVPIPPIASIVHTEQYAFAYTGIDSTVVQYIRERQFDELLAYRKDGDQLFVIESDDFKGHFLLDEYGILRGWMNKVPIDQIEFEVNAK